MHLVGDIRRFVFLGASANSKVRFTFLLTFDVLDGLAIPRVALICARISAPDCQNSAPSALPLQNALHKQPNKQSADPAALLLHPLDRE